MTSTDLFATPEREGGDTLIYEGATIRQRGLMLNLTDMWKAAGSPDNRRPPDWLSLPETQRFRVYARARWSSLASLMPPPNAGKSGIWTSDPDGLVATTRVPATAPARARRMAARRACSSGGRHQQSP